MDSYYEYVDTVLDENWLILENSKLPSTRSSYLETNNIMEEELLSKSVFGNTFILHTIKSQIPTNICTTKFTDRLDVYVTDNCTVSLIHTSIIHDILEQCTFKYSSSKIIIDRYCLKSLRMVSSFRSDNYMQKKYKYNIYKPKELGMTNTIDNTIDSFCTPKIDGIHSILYINSLGVVTNDTIGPHIDFEIYTDNYTDSVIECELIGDTFVLFDILVLNDRSINNVKIAYRRQMISRIINSIINVNSKFKFIVPPCACNVPSELIEPLANYWTLYLDLPCDGLICYTDVDKIPYKLKPVRHLTIDVRLVYNLNNKVELHYREHNHEQKWNFYGWIDTINLYNKVANNSIIEISYDYNKNKFTLHRVRTEINKLPNDIRTIMKTLRKSLDKQMTQQSYTHVSNFFRAKPNAAKLSKRFKRWRQIAYNEQSKSSTVVILGCGYEKEMDLINKNQSCIVVDINSDYLDRAKVRMLKAFKQWTYRKPRVKFILGDLNCAKVYYDIEEQIKNDKIVIQCHWSLMHFIGSEFYKFVNKHRNNIDTIWISLFDTDMISIGSKISYGNGWIEFERESKGKILVKLLRYQKQIRERCINIKHLIDRFIAYNWLVDVRESITHSGISASLLQVTNGQQRDKESSSSIKQRQETKQT